MRVLPVGGRTYDILVTSPDPLPLSYRGHVRTNVTKLGSCDKHPAYCHPGGGGRTLLYKPYRYVPPQKGTNFAPFWSENKYRLCHFGLESGMVFEKCGNVWTFQWKRKIKKQIRNGIRHLHISHNTPYSHSLLKFCISIVFNFSWDGCSTQEKWKTKVMQNFGGQIRCIMGDVQVAY